METYWKGNKNRTEVFGIKRSLAFLVSPQEEEKQEKKQLREFIKTTRLNPESMIYYFQELAL